MVVRYVFSAVLYLTVVQGQQMSTDGCYQIYPNSKVNCMKAYRGQVVAGEQQCRDLCTADAGQCKAAQFTQATSQCDLYSTFLPVGQVGRKKRDLDWGFRFRRGSYLGTGQGYRPTYAGTYPAPAPAPTQYRPPQAYQPAPAPAQYRPPQTYQPAPAPAQYRPPQTYQPAPAPAQYRPPQTYPAAGGSYQPKPTYGGAKPSYGGQGYAACGGYGPTVQSVAGCTYCVPTGTCLGAQTTLPPAPVTTASPACPAGQVLRYFKGPETKIQENADTTFSADSEQACLTACTNNQQPNGQTAMCKSADYNSQTKQCLIYSSLLLPPQGTATPVSDTAFVHYEKICIDAALGGRCPGPYVFAPQKILIGFAQTVTTASSFSDCLSLCSNSQSRFGFACQSGMFYYQEATSNCILNAENRLTKPDVFQQETTDKVTYYETGCPATRRARSALGEIRNRNVLQLGLPDFGPWTLCDHKDLDHKRFKQCSTLNPNKCSKDQNICDPKKEDEYDLQIVNPVKHTPNQASSPAPNANDDAARLVTKATNKENILQQAQGRSSGNSQGGAGLPQGKCLPLINLDGTKDCQHGTMFNSSGQRSNCVPKFTECIG